MYKIHHEMVDIRSERYITPATRTQRTSHQMAYVIPRSSADYHQYSFFPRTVRDWNCLPPDTVAAPTLDAFKSRLPVSARAQ